MNESDGEQRPEAALAASASCLILIAIGLFLQVQTRDPFAVQWKGGGVSVSSLTWVVMYLAFATVGKVLVARSAGAVGWLCLVIGLIQSISFFTGRYAAFALFQSNGGVPIGEWAAWVASWTFGPTLGALGLLLLVFPDGRFMSMRWRAMAWVSSAAVAAQTLAVALKPGPTTYSLRGGSLVNPAGVEWLGGVTEPLSELAGIGAMLLVVTGVVSLVVRYIRASASQRVQIRCVATAGAALVFVLVAALLAIAFGSAGEGGQNTGLGRRSLRLSDWASRAFLSRSAWPCFVGHARKGPPRLGRPNREAQRCVSLRPTAAGWPNCPVSQKLRQIGLTVTTTPKGPPRWRCRVGRFWPQIPVRTGGSSTIQRTNVQGQAPASFLASTPFSHPARPPVAGRR